jgi:hypothetical protein
MEELDALRSERITPGTLNTYLNNILVFLQFLNNYQPTEEDWPGYSCPLDDAFRTWMANKSRNEIKVSMKLNQGRTQKASANEFSEL